MDTFQPDRDEDQWGYLNKEALKILLELNIRLLSCCVRGNLVLDHASNLLNGLQLTVIWRCLHDDVVPILGVLIDRVLWLYASLVDFVK